MTPDKLEHLLNSPADRPLDGLESAVWSRLQVQDAQQKRLRRLASLQLGLFLAAVMGSAVVGGIATNQALAKGAELSVFSPHAVMAPSSRLIGARP
jgi:hypothetical protein